MARVTISELQNKLEQAYIEIDNLKKELTQLKRRKVVPEDMYIALMKRYKELRDKSPETQKHNARNAGRKPVSQDVKEQVLKLNEQGLSMRKIAEELNIAIGTVHKIINEHSDK